MTELKRLPLEAIPAALEKAEHYRLLNEAREAECICLDILDVDPDNQRAVITLLLARTDQFSRTVGASVQEARELLPRVKGDYEQAYYAGIISERQGKAQLARGGSGWGVNAYHWLREAMEWFDKADRLHPEGNSDAVLRWNTCVRLLEQHDHVRPGADDATQSLLE